MLPSAAMSTMTPAMRLKPPPSMPTAELRSGQLGIPVAGPVEGPALVVCCVGSSMPLPPQAASHSTHMPIRSAYLVLRFMLLLRRTTALARHQLRSHDLLTWSTARNATSVNDRPVCARVVISPLLP